MIISKALIHHGIESFDIYILERFDSHDLILEDLREIEQTYIDHIDDWSMCYNMNRKTTGYFVEWAKVKGTPVDMYTLDGTYIKTFDSMTDAANETGARVSNISQCKQRMIKSSGGYIWTVSGEDCRLENNKSCVKTVQYTLEGNFIAEFDSIADALRNIDVNPEKYTIVKNVMIGKGKTAFGYQWRRKGDKPIKNYERTSPKAKRIGILDDNGDVYIEFDSNRKAAKWLAVKMNEPNASSTRIERIAKNISKRVKDGYKGYGYCWVFI